MMYLSPKTSYQANTKIYDPWYIVYPPPPAMYAMIHGSRKRKG